MSGSKFDQKIDALKEVVSTFPKQPGVYLMKNAQGKIIYIGKAKILRHRVRSYLSSSYKGAKTEALVRHINEIEYILSRTEAEALLLEATLIKNTVQNTMFG